MKRIAAVSLFAHALFAQPGLAPPQIGIAADASGALRPLFGITGNFVWGDAITGSVNSAAFSGRFGLVKTDAALVVLDQKGRKLSSVDSGPGEALFAFSADGFPALAYTAGALFQWTDGAFQQVSFDPLNIEGAIASVFSAGSDHAGLLVQNDQGLWDVRLNLASGVIDQQTAITDLIGPAMRLPSGDIVSNEPTGVVILRQDGTEVHLAAQLPASFSLSQIGEAWVQLTDDENTVQFAIRVSPGGEAIFQLPGADQ